MRDDDILHAAALGAGDPGALDALFGGAFRGARAGLVEAYRRHGWLAARLDPLGLMARAWRETLDAEHWGLEAAEAEDLAAVYCGDLGWEIGHVQDAERYDWLAARAEAGQPVTAEERAAALRLIAMAELFEAATLTRLPTVKTFSLSGAEAYLVAMETVIRESGARRVVVGGMHRGRLTQMALIFHKPIERLIAECLGLPDLPKTLGASSDAPYHLGWEGARADGVSVWVAPHPSHLSIVAPVAMGRARAEGAGADAGVLPLMLHTDAAFAGQGVNAELMQLSGLPAYAVGGSVHLLLDNQIGFTTGAEAARTARRASDVAKCVEAPVLHVNGDAPDAVIRAARVAARYRARFGADILVDVIACRRRGHNEIDEPRFTQPARQRAIDALPPLSTRYARTVGSPAPDLTDFRAELDRAFESAPRWKPARRKRPLGLAADIETRMLAKADTGVDLARLRALGRRITGTPEGFEPHAKIRRFLDKRREAIDAGEAVDWATAEALALASLLEDGRAVRLTGQDTARGAFSQRHLRLHDQRDGRAHGLLDGLGARFELYDTPLMENAALAFEFGLGLDAPERLVIWEAQFGDFLNVAQPVFDQFVTGAEDRWLLTSALVMLLPHGDDGGGPDHAHGHLERILARCARGNIQVMNATTPANYFHALRRQLAREYLKPLVVLTPKWLLRHPACVSPLRDFAPDRGFRPVIGEKRPKARRAILCSGKLFQLLDAARRERGLEEAVALIRLEQLYPFPARALAAALRPFGQAELIWAQEEPANLGAFTWADRRIEQAAGRPARLVAKPAAASPAMGWESWRLEQQRRLIDAALAPESGA